MESATPGRRFATALSEAISQRGLSLERLHSRLDEAGVAVSVASLSYWQTGRSLPRRVSSQATLNVLERLLELDRDSLSALVVQDRRQRYPDGRHEWQSFVQSDEVARLVREMGLRRDNFSRLSVHDRLHIGADRIEKFENSRQILRAERTNIQSWPISYVQDADKEAYPSIEAVSGCTIGEVANLPDKQILVAEIVLPRPLQRGEAWMIELRVTWGQTRQQSSRLNRRCPEHTREVISEVLFDTTTLPRRVVGFAGATTCDCTDDPVDTPVFDGLAQRVRFDVPVGIQGLRWEWD